MIYFSFNFPPIASQHFKNPRCEAIVENTPCYNNGQYNSTSFPNAFNHQNQNEAMIDLQNIWRGLKNVQCHPHAKLFFCTAYMPVCTNRVNYILQPCQEFCQQIYDSCAQKISKNGIEWPAKNKCHLLPKLNHGEACISANSIANSNSNTRGQSNSLIATSECSVEKVTCPSHLYLSLNDEKISRNRYTFLTTQYRHVSSCGAPCNDKDTPENALFWSSEDRFLIRTVISIFSTISLVLTTFAIATNATASNRFRYPEQPIIWLATCYFFISLSYLAGSLTKNDIACTDLQVGESGIMKIERIVSQGTDRTSCTLNFMLLY